MADTFHIELRHRVKRWVFPASRFVEYGRTDEEWCRFFGVGHEVETEESITIPQAYIRSIDLDGSIEFGAVPSPGIRFTCG